MLQAEFWVTGTAVFPTLFLERYEAAYARLHAEGYPLFDQQSSIDEHYTGDVDPGPHTVHVNSERAKKSSSVSQGTTTLGVQHQNTDAAGRSITAEDYRPTVHAQADQVSVRRPITGGNSSVRKMSLRATTVASLSLGPTRSPLKAHHMSGIDARKGPGNA